MAALPLLLAGPIVRRVDYTSASVWVALSKPAEVELRLFVGSQTSAGTGTVQTGDLSLGSGSIKTRRVGQNLHIVVTAAQSVADPESLLHFQLLPGTLYSYDIIVRTEDGETIGLRDMGLLRDDPAMGLEARSDPNISEAAPQHYALGYETDVLPSFITPAGRLQDIRLAHASCRKTHSAGTDALSWLDDEIEANLQNPANRVQQLFLTGDQIYADDVPTCLLPLYHDLATDLIGDEDLPMPDNPAVQVTLTSAPPMRRTVLVRTDGGLTSTDAQNHLLTVGEYSAAYLLAWSPRLWRALADEDTCYAHATATSDFTLTNLRRLYRETGLPAEVQSLADTIALLKKLNGPTFNRERQRTIVFAATVGKVARVLANTPTYMIFDDHEVTDDWNLDEEWSRRVYNRPLGRAVVRNGLIAYSFFQGWGADWRLYSSTQGLPDPVNARMLTLAERYLEHSSNRPANLAADLDKMFDLDRDQPDRAIFHYAAPGGLFQTQVIDTRTRRSQRVGGLGPAALLGDDVGEQIPENPAQGGTAFLLLVAPTPILGPETLDHLIAPIYRLVADTRRALSGNQDDADPQNGSAGTPSSMALKRSSGTIVADVESWAANPIEQHRLLHRLAGHERIVLLGGDVHYGTTIAADWGSWDRRLGEGSRTSARFVQLTSSAAHNAPGRLMETIYRGTHWASLLLSGSAVELFGFENEAAAPITIPEGERASMTRMHRLQDKPSILPAHGWPPDSTLTTEPDWWMRQIQIRDTRNDADRTSPFEEIAGALDAFFTTAAADLSPIDQAQKILSAHANAANSFAPLRDFVMTNNIGLIQFSQNPGGPLTVIHSLLSTTVQGYPEDNIDEALATLRPMGATAVLSPGRAYTVTQTPLVPGAIPILNEGRQDA